MNKAKSELKVVKEVTDAMLEKKVKELCELVDRYEGDKAGFASWAFVEITAYAQSSYYEALGILYDAMIRYKELSDEIALEDKEKKGE